MESMSHFIIHSNFQNSHHLNYGQIDHLHVHQRHFQIIFQIIGLSEKTNKSGCQFLIYSLEEPPNCQLINDAPFDPIL